MMFGHHSSLLTTPLGPAIEPYKPPNKVSGDCRRQSNGHCNLIFPPSLPAPNKVQVIEVAHRCLVTGIN